MATIDAAARHFARPAREDDDRAAVWAFVWTLFAFKMATVVLLLFHMRTWEAGLVIGATTWYWFPAVGALVAAPLLFRYRLRKVRARRRALLHAEWMVTEDDVAADAARR